MELKNACCGATGIMMVVEIQEGKERMALKPHHDEMSNAASIVMRLLETGDLCGSRRIVYGDSFFASWDMCNELMHKGLYFKGIVKQNSGGYPKEFFRDWWHLGIEVAKANELFRQGCTARRIAIKVDVTLTRNSRAAGLVVKGTRALAFEQVQKEIDERKKAQNPHGHHPSPTNHRQVHVLPFCRNKAQQHQEAFIDSKRPAHNVDVYSRYSHERWQYPPPNLCLRLGRPNVEELYWHQRSYTSRYPP